MDNPMTLTIPAAIDAGQFAAGDSAAAEGQVNILAVYSVDRIPRSSLWLGDYEVSFKVNRDTVDTFRMDAGVVPLLADHNPSAVIGRITDYEVGKDKVTVTAQIAPNPKAQEVYADIQAGVRPGISVGMGGMKVKEVTTRQDKVPHYEVVSFAINEVSSVGQPALPKAQVQMALADDFELPEDIIAPIREAKLKAEAEAKAAAAAEEDKDMGKEEATQTEAVDTTEAVDNAAAAADKPVADPLALVKLGQDFGDAEGAAAAAVEGKSREEYLSDLLRRRGAEKETVPAQAKTEREFNFGAIFNYLTVPNDTTREDAAYELSFVDEWQGKAVNRERLRALPGYVPGEGLVIPWEAFLQGKGPEAEKFAISILGATKATDAVSTTVYDYILEPQEQRFLTGMATVIMSPGPDQKLPTLKRPWDTTWASDESDITADDPVLSSVSLTPKQISGAVDFSLLADFQTQGRLESALTEFGLSEMGYAIDEAFINGSGAANNPRGLLNFANVQELADDTTAAGPGITWDHYLEMIQLIKEKRALDPQGRVPGGAYLIPPVLERKAKSDLKVAGNAYLGTVLMPGAAPEIDGYPVYVTNHLPAVTATQTALFGNLMNAYVGLWAGIQVLYNPYRVDGRRKISFLAWMDVAVPLPELFVKHKRTQ